MIQKPRLLRVMEAQQDAQRDRFQRSRRAFESAYGAMVSVLFRRYAEDAQCLARMGAKIAVVTEQWHRYVRATWQSLWYRDGTYHLPIVYRCDFCEDQELPENLR